MISGEGPVLPILKSLVERHGGRITLTSDQVAFGTTVPVTMRRAESGERRAESVPEPIGFQLFCEIASSATISADARSRPSWVILSRRAL